MATKKTAAAKAAKPAAKKAAKKAPAKKAATAKSVAKKAVPKKAAVQQPAKKSTQQKSVAKKGATSTKKSGTTSMSKQDITKQTKVQAVQQKKTPAKQAVKEDKHIAATKAAKPENTPMAKKAVETPKEVKAPKTSVKTSVPYQPEYKPLDQRQEGENRKGNDPLVRYTDSDLNEFKELINKKLDAAKKELAYLQGLITRKDHLGGDETDNRYMTMEDGSMSMEREQLSQMASRQITYIDHLEKALIRIENKTYGICRVTGKLIDKARLRAVPHATLSLEAKLGLVKPGGGSNSNNE
jgi:RNA polymerase-binding transcription factor DksA